VELATKAPTVAALAQAHPMVSLDSEDENASKLNFSSLRTVKETKKNLDDPSDQAFIQSLFNQPYMLTNPEMFKHRCKIYLPHVQGINYVGLLIGPKGIYQKKLEEQTGCKILIRGKNSHKEGYPPQPDDHEEQHILILSDTEEKINAAKYLVERILNSDEKTRH